MKTVQTTNKFKSWGAFFSPDGKYIVAAGDDGSLALWRLENGLWSSQDQKVAKVWPAHKGIIWNVAFSPDSQKIASGGEDGNVRIWNLKGEKTAQFDGHSGPVRSVKFTADSQHLVNSADDGTTRLWNLPEQLFDNTNIDDLPKNQVNNAQNILNSNNNLRAFVDKDNKIKIRDASGNELNSFQDHIGKVLAINFSSNSQLLVSAGQDNTIRVWKNLDKKQEGRYSSIFQVDDEHQINTVIFSPDNQRIIAGDNAGYIRVWDGHIVPNSKVILFLIYFPTIRNFLVIIVWVINKLVVIAQMYRMLLE